jgi:uncharacterized membrane protein
MGILIIGSCFVVALVALIALVFILRSEPRAKPQASEDASIAPVPVLAQPEQEQTSRIVPMPKLEPEQVEEHHTYVLNGLFRELSVGLQTLYQQSQEMEQRLNTLTTLLEQVERSQDEQPGA